jgi:hypothetical protein
MEEKDYISIDAEFLLKLVCRKKDCCGGCPKKPICNYFIKMR